MSIVLDVDRVTLTEKFSQIFPDAPDIFIDYVKMYDVEGSPFPYYLVKVNDKIYGVVSNKYRPMCLTPVLSNVLSEITKDNKIDMEKSKIIVRRAEVVAKIVLKKAYELDLPISDKEREFYNMNLDKDVFYPALYVYNGYTGNASIRLLYGLFRLICTNGMVREEFAYGFKFRHLGSKEFSYNPEFVVDISKVFDDFKALHNKKIEWTEELAEVVAKKFSVRKRFIEKYANEVGINNGYALFNMITRDWSERIDNKKLTPSKLSTTRNLVEAIMKL